MARLIPLSRGLMAFVDEDDHAWLSQWKWHAHSSGRHMYAARNARVDEPGPCLVYMHREILTPPPGMVTDHINGHTMDNTRANLRVATYVENGANSGARPGSSSIFRGVRFDPRRGRYAASFRVGRTSYWLGYHRDPADAARAYDLKAREVHGEFARLNFPEAA